MSALSTTPPNRRTPASIRSFMTSQSPDPGTASGGDDPFCLLGTLPEQLPVHPWGIVEAWWTLAHRGEDNSGPVQPNPNAMALATVDGDGRPSNRIVLCKSIDVDNGCLLFHTNYHGRKGRDLDRAPHAAVCLYWDTLDRQIRVEGPVLRCSEVESDSYFATRPLDRRLGAWASDQSEPIESREALLERFARVMERFGVPGDGRGGVAPNAKADVPRPPHWGGYRLWAERVELWIAGAGRFHDRAEWVRPVEVANGVPSLGQWSRTRLQP